MSPARRDENPLAGSLSLFVSRGAHLLVGGLALAFIIFAGIDSTKTRPNDGTVWLLGRPDLEVLAVPARQQGPQPLLRPGDKIIGIAHRLVSTPQEAANQLKRQRPGTTVDYLIERDGRQLNLPVALAPARVVDRSYLVNVLLTTVYLLIGFLVYLRSNNERPARLFFLLCLLFGMYFMTNLEQSSYFWGDIITQNGGAFARFMLPAIFLQFFLVFPRNKDFLTRHPFLSPLVYVLPLMFYIRFTLDQFFGSEGGRIGTTTWLILGLYYVGGLAALLHGYFSYRDPLLRERVRILTFGTLAAVVPFLIFKIGLEELTAHGELAQLGIVPLLAIPVSFGYCVARYQIMQIDLLLKRSLLYSFMTGGLLLIYLAVVFWIGNQALNFAATSSPLISVGVTLAIAAVLWPLRGRLQKALEGRFYHSRANIAEVIEEFSKEIPRLINRDALLKRVGERLCTVLAVPRLGFYAPLSGAAPGSFELIGRTERPGEDLRITDPDASVIPPATTQKHLCPEELDLSITAKTIERRNEPFWVEVSRQERPDMHRAISREQAELTAALAEQRLLFSAGVALLVPLATSGRLVGLMALPAKPDGEDYQLYELRLLTIVAGQVALQIENARLLEEEVAKRALEEEMEMARQIQSRLLPARIPRIEGVDMHAVNISSKQVSGDYYDVIEREDGRLALVIADVSGKGMPASLLASNLQAALRAQCSTNDSPGKILSLINKQMHATTDPQHFATLFLCIFDPQTRGLTYSSGGHNAPVLLRGTGGVELLEKGGLPLGAFDFGEYEEGEIMLEEGDLLFLYTDGLTETTRDSVDEYGEERLTAFLQRHQQIPVADLIAKVGVELEEFRGRADADDDITLISLKITGDAVAAQARVEND